MLHFFIISVMIINAFVHGANFLGRCREWHQAQVMLRTKAWLEREVSSFLLPQLAAERGWKPLCLLGPTPTTRKPFRRPGTVLRTSTSRLSWPRPQSKPEPVAAKRPEPFRARRSSSSVFRWRSGFVRPRNHWLPWSVKGVRPPLGLIPQPVIRKKNQGTRRIAPRFSTTKWLIEDGRVQLPSRPPSGNRKTWDATPQAPSGVQVHQCFLLDNDV